MKLNLKLNYEGKNKVLDAYRDKHLDIVRNSSDCSREIDKNTSKAIMSAFVGDIGVAVRKFNDGDKEVLSKFYKEASQITNRINRKQSVYLMSNKMNEVENIALMYL